jgi:tRNA 2-thiouridine synthesizing protein D
LKFTLVLTASPISHQATKSAYHFAKALLLKGHTIHRVFFYQDAVYLGSRLNCVTQDEPLLTEQWQSLASEYQFDLTLCITASERRGILNSDEAKRNEKDSDNLAENFQLAGLGQLFEACFASDRVIEFGA